MFKMITSSLISVKYCFLTQLSNKSDDFDCYGTFQSINIRQWMNDEISCPSKCTRERNSKMFCPVIREGVRGYSLTLHDITC